MKSLLFILLFINTCYAQPVHTTKQPLTNQIANQLARQIVDELMNIENTKAMQTLRQLEQSFLNYPLLRFMKITPLWAEAEINKSNDYEHT